MPTITMPQLGETVTEGTITKWLKSVGDNVSRDELLFEVSTDKVDSEVPSSEAGVLTEILVQEGETVPVGAPLAVIGEASGTAPAAAPVALEDENAGVEEKELTASQPEAEAPQRTAPTEPTPESQPAAPPAPPTAPAPEPAPAAADAASPDGDGEGRRAVLSPVVRKLAKEHGVDLASIMGTGAGGRITREDVLAFVEGKTVSERKEAAAPPRPAPRPAPAPATTTAPPTAPAPAATAPAAAPAPAAPAPAAARAAAPEPTPARATPLAHDVGRTESLSTIRVRIAEHMRRSKDTSAHVFSAVEVDMEEVERVRQAHKDGFRQREGFGLTYLPFIARATVDALSAHPAVNASIDIEQKTVTFHDYVNLGIAVDLDEKGLIVPVVKRADEVTVTGLARRVRELADKARSRQLSPDDVVGSTFTVTNPGPFGSVMSAPVINQPNVAILSTEAVEKRVVVVNDMIAIRHRMYLCLSWDHRAFDGSTAVLFLARIKQNLETWEWEPQLS